MRKKVRNSGCILDSLSGQELRMGRFESALVRVEDDFGGVLVKFICIRFDSRNVAICEGLSTVASRQCGWSLIPDVYVSISADSRTGESISCRLIRYHLPMRLMIDEKQFVSCNARAALQA